MRFVCVCKKQNPTYRNGIGHSDWREAGVPRLWGSWGRLKVPSLIGAP